jgi:hypothetical protein
MVLRLQFTRTNVRSSSHFVEIFHPSPFKRLVVKHYLQRSPYNFGTTLALLAIEREGRRGYGVGKDSRETHAECTGENSTV